MSHYIWYENDSGFKIKKIDGPPSMEDIADSISESVNLIELMNSAALNHKITEIVHNLISEPEVHSVEFRHACIVDTMK